MAMISAFPVELSAVDQSFDNATPYKASKKALVDELASTDTGGEDFEVVYSAAAASSDDSEADAHDEAVSDCLAYSVTFMLQLRMAVGQRFPAQLGYASQPAPKKERAEKPKKTTNRRQAERSEVPATPVVPKAKNDEEKIARAARSILNKLTIEKFDKLYEQFATCGFQTPDHIAILMREIFEKATVEHHFIPMYADLCVKLEADPRIMAAVEAEDETNNFRRLLLTQCQCAFEQLLEPWTPEGAGAGDEELCAMRKRRAIGNVKLVAELMCRGMLSSRLLCSCAEELIRGFESAQCPEALESLAVLLTVAGPTFDVASFKYLPRLDGIFARVRELTGERKVASRVRFLLRDVLDLRKATWSDRARPPAQTSAPMKLEEVKQQAAEKVQPKSAAKRDSQDLAVSRLRTLSAMIGDGSSKARDTKPQQKSEKNFEKSAPRSPPKSPSNQERPKLFEVKESLPAVSAPSPTDAATSPRKRASRVVEDKATAPVEVVQVRLEEEVAPIAAVVPVPAPAPRVRQLLRVPSFDGGVFDCASFHWELTGILRELAGDRNVAAAVNKVRVQHVPEELQAKEFADILTRAAEEGRGPNRRSALAFAAGLAAANPSAFVRVECLSGVQVFFEQIYESLCSEVPRLDTIAAAEIIPTLLSVFTEAELLTVAPEELVLQAQQ